MLDRTHRFHGLGSLRFVYRHGETARGPLGAMKFARNQRRSAWRTAVVVSRKVHKSAVVRNRIRRRIYEVIRAVGPQITVPFDMVFIAYNDQIARMPADELHVFIVAQLHAAGIISAADGASHAIVKAKE